MLREGRPEEKRKEKAKVPAAARAARPGTGQSLSGPFFFSRQRLARSVCDGFIGFHLKVGHHPYTPGKDRRVETY